jgi:hypothetical protein
MSRINFNYNLGDQRKIGEDNTTYDIRKYLEGKTYNTSQLEKFSIEKEKDEKKKTYPSQYKFFCKAENYLDKKTNDLNYIGGYIRRLKTYLNTPITIKEIIL